MDIKKDDDGKYLNQTKLFIDILTDGKDNATYQTFDDSKKHRAPLARILHGTLDEHIDELTRRNEKGAGVFVMVNQGDGIERKASSVKKVRALFIDLDDAPDGIQPVIDSGLEPHMVIQSSQGKYHAYWLVDDVSLSDFTKLQKSLAEKFNSDPAVCDLPRVMRLVGFTHNKTEIPFMCELLYASEDRTNYSVNHIIDSLGINLNSTKKETKKKKLNNKKFDKIELSKIKKALYYISSEDRDNWLKVGMSLHATEIGQQAYAIWCDWSEQSDKFSLADQSRTWDSFKIDDDGITIGTLYDLAKSNGWDYSQKLDRPKPEYKEDLPVDEGDFMGWASNFVVSDEEAEQYDNPNFLYPDLIIAGHVIAIPAPPNGGKTTIFMHIASVLAKRGNDVFYVNCDVGQSDAKEMVLGAKRDNFTLLLPDLKTGLTMEDVIYELEVVNESGKDLSTIVFIFDTLKKMVDVISKKAAKELYKILRSLTAKGMTIILLAHTNKYPDAEGKPIFEGTGDLRADVDELIYLIPQKHDDGSMTISTEPDKVRGKFKPITFNISKDRAVTQANKFVDVIDQISIKKQKENDSVIVDIIMEAVNEGHDTGSHIKSYAKKIESGFGWRSINAVLLRYVGDLWESEYSNKNNSKHYALTGRTLASKKLKLKPKKYHKT